MQRHHKIAFSAITLTVFTLALTLACADLYYSILNEFEYSGGELTHWIDQLLGRQARIDKFVTVIIAALPSITLPVCINNKHGLTRLGIFVSRLIIITLITSFMTLIILVPTGESLESERTAELVLENAKIIAGFSLTYLGLLLNFKFDGFSTNQHP